jgi:RimJ/RimL family protein N-acetyltransferase
MQIYLETERLFLRRFTTADADYLYKLDSDPEVMRYLTGGKPTSRDAIKNNILSAFLTSYEPYAGLGVWAAIEKASGQFVGWFSMRAKDAVRPHDVELGYRLRRSVWGQGYATEGVRALIHKGFTELGVQRVTATTYQDNLASRRVMEKAGLKFVRAFRYTLEDLQSKDTFDGSEEEIWDGDDVEYELMKG